MRLCICNETLRVLRSDSDAAVLRRAVGHVPGGQHHPVGGRRGTARRHGQRHQHGAAAAQADEPVAGGRRSPVPGHTGVLRPERIAGDAQRRTAETRVARLRHRQRPTRYVAIFFFRFAFIR